MATVTLKVKDSKLKFFKDLIQNFSFVKVKEEIKIEEDGDSDEYIRNHIKESLEELNDILGEKTGDTRPRTFQGIIKKWHYFLGINSPSIR